MTRTFFGFLGENETQCEIWSSRFLALQSCAVGREMRN